MQDSGQGRARERLWTGRWMAGGWIDLSEGLANWRVCHLMGLNEVRRWNARFRLGQLWLTLSMGIMVSALGLVWSTLWKVPVAHLPTGWQNIVFRCVFLGLTFAEARELAPSIAYSPRWGNTLSYR